MTAPSTMPARAADWIIFVVVYAGIAIGTIPYTRLSRSAIALLGAIAVVACGRLSFAAATEHRIDWTTLALLFSLMLLAASLRLAGFYTRILQTILAHASRPLVLLTGIVAASALLSALFANDIVCLAFTPVLAAALAQARRNPIPYLMALATSSNIGSAATIIGNPQNMLIGQSAHLSFGHFSAVITPLVIACLALNVVVVACVYRRALFAPPASETTLQASTPEMPIVPFRPWHATKALLITAGLVVTFLFTPVPREIAALVAAGLVLISRRQDPRKLFALVDWDLILLFIGLFVVIGNVREHGLIDAALDFVRSRGIPLYNPLPFSAITLVLSNIVSNVPAVLLLKPGLPIPLSPADSATHAWYLLATVSTFAGNLTLLGSIANLIVAEQAQALGIRLSFIEYLKVGLPLTLLTTGLAVVYFVWILPALSP
jgi:Na+/H+ antiporter NhaD/arsenite permease-like protein